MTRGISSLLILSAALTAAGTEAAVGMEQAPALRVLGMHADDRGVSVTVANPAPVTRSGILLVRTFVLGREISSPVRFRIEAGATATIDVAAPFAGTLVDVTIVLDDGSPF
jgi:hypothetical protein